MCWATRWYLCRCLLVGIGLLGNERVTCLWCLMEKFIINTYSMLFYCLLRTKGKQYEMSTFFGLVEWRPTDSSTKVLYAPAHGACSKYHIEKFWSKLLNNGVYVALVWSFIKHLWMDRKRGKGKLKCFLTSSQRSTPPALWLEDGRSISFGQSWYQSFHCL